VSKMSKLITEKYFLATRTHYPGYAQHGLSISIHMDRNPCSKNTATAKSNCLSSSAAATEFLYTHKNTM